LRRLPVAVFAVLFLMWGGVAEACPVCYGAPEDPMTRGMSNGILTLLGFVGFVQVGFVALFISFWRRSRQIAARRESLQLIHGGKRDQ
jgi:polyferredoxin